jgi:thioredoxin reductase (NADPH)
LAGKPPAAPGLKTTSVSLRASAAPTSLSAREQACKFGAEILLGREALRGEFSTGKRVGYLADGTKLVARTAICATGVEYNRLGLPNEEKFTGTGIYYGAGASEASFCVNENIFLVEVVIPPGRPPCTSPKSQEK